MNFTLNLNGRLLTPDKPVIAGIINLTPDSFYPGSRIADERTLITRAVKMVEEGALFLDLGGYSSRPGAAVVTEEEEHQRLLPALRLLRKELPDTPLSVDTFRSSIAEKVSGEFGVEIINDISGGSIDNKMFETIAKHKLAYVLTHIKGVPETMQQDPKYDDVTREVISWLNQRVRELSELGVCDVIVDPGFGFGKNVTDNFTLLRELEEFSILGRPVMAGLSRKSMIWRSLETTPEGSLNGTTALHMSALERGAMILRVHDVREAWETIQLFVSLRGKGSANNY